MGGDQEGGFGVRRDILHIKVEKLDCGIDRSVIGSESESVNPV